MTEMSTGVAMFAIRIRSVFDCIGTPSPPSIVSAETWEGGRVDADLLIDGVLHVFVAFDWGDEINLAQAQQLAPSRAQLLVRRKRTPASIAYRPPPLLFALPPVSVELPELGRISYEGEVTVFDFAAASAAIHIPFKLTAAALSRLAAGLADAEAVVDAARMAAAPLFEQLRPAIKDPCIQTVAEEYFVIQIKPSEGLPSPEQLVREEAWLAGLLQLEAAELAPEQIQEALRLRISYGPRDLLVADWQLAVLVDVDCDETLQVIEFANLQLLEFRSLGQRIDDEQTAAYRLIHPLTQTWLPLWRLQDRPIRVLGDLRMEAHAILERTSNGLKLFGDQYLARAYRLVSNRFHLDEWSHSVRESLEVVEGAYKVLSDQASLYRTEIMEIIVIILIASEIIMAFVKPH